jgi:hypothetical protein
VISNSLRPVSMFSATGTIFLYLGTLLGHGYSLDVVILGVAYPCLRHGYANGPGAWPLAFSGSRAYFTHFSVLFKKELTLNLRTTDPHHTRILLRRGRRLILSAWHGLSSTRY